MKTFFRSLLGITAVLTFSSAASAEQFSCSSKILEVAQSENGGTFVRTNFGMFNICSVSAAMGSVSTDACRGWITHLLAARGLGKHVEFYFDTSNPANAQMVAPYCRTENFGWYFRPPFFVAAIVTE